MLTPNYDKAKKEAERILQENDVIAPVVPVFDLAENLGYTIKFFTPEGDLNQIAGFTHPNSNVIFVNKADPVYRQSFTVAHELGHIVLKHNPNEYGVLLRNTHVETTEAEKEANAFAAYLLMPDKLIRETMAKYNLDKTHFEMLAGIFGVSAEAMRNRLRRYPATS